MPPGAQVRGARALLLHPLQRAKVLRGGDWLRRGEREVSRVTNNDRCRLSFKVPDADAKGYKKGFSVSLLPYVGLKGIVLTVVVVYATKESSRRRPKITTPWVFVVAEKTVAGPCVWNTYRGTFSLHHQKKNRYLRAWR